MEYLEYLEEITEKFCKSKTKFLDQKVEFLHLSKPLKKAMISQEINWLTILCSTNSWQDYLNLIQKRECHPKKLCNPSSSIKVLTENNLS